ncbi:unnamed protein product, partial [Tilletia controversa]
QLEPLVRLTPLERATNLSARLGCEVLLKREDLQPFFSFKLRGAFNMMRQLTPEQKWKGQFPERPNALQKFLVTLHETNTKYPRNITLFHYRNYGSDVGKVLAGIAVDLDSSSDPGADGALSEEEKEVEARRDLDRWLTEEQGYPFVEETENVVYRRFLREG